MRDFRKQQVWEKAHHLTVEVYKITKKFPKEELYGMTSQIRRSSASIAANMPKAVVGIVTPSLRVSCELPEAPRVKLNITCCFQKISDFFLCPITSLLPPK